MGNSVKSPIKEDLEDEDEDESKQMKATLKQVKTKLEKSKRKLGKNEVADLAEKLIDKEKIKKEYFSHLLKQTEGARNAIKDEQNTFPTGFPNQGTRRASEQRMAEHIEQVSNLEAKLILHELKDSHVIQQVAHFVNKHIKSFTFGPFHASILIGNVLLEWGPDSLVIPHKVSEVHNKDVKAVLFTNLHEQPFDGQIPTIPLTHEEGASQETVASSFEEINDITKEKDQLIDELADVIVRFNSKMTYGIFTNNCQHFIRDVLYVLGITDPEKVFRGRIKQHAAIVIARDKQKATVEFNSHMELDRYIQAGNIDAMSHDDLEFAYCHYLLFHAWGQRFPYEDAWRCNPNECQASKLAIRVQ